MTTPDERTRAVLWAREFLEELINPAKTPGVPEIVRHRAFMLLRHYPDAKDMKLARFAFDEWFALPEESDIGRRWSIACTHPNDIDRKSRL